jgi:ABC-type polar amino acid transport system ATPase subunit
MSMMVDLHDITFGTDIAERVTKIKELFMQKPEARKMFVWEKDKQTIAA